jgi:hypothetical protein
MPMAKSNKYILAYCDGRHLYFPPGAAALLEQSDMPIVLVEAEKSTLALTAWATRTGTHLLPIGMCGCWSWRGVIGKQEAPNGEREDVKGPFPDRDYCDGRRVYVLVVIVRKRLSIEASLYQLLRIFCIALFEKPPILRALQNIDSQDELQLFLNQLILFDF